MLKKAQEKHTHNQALITAKTENENAKILKLYGYLEEVEERVPEKERGC